MKIWFKKNIKDLQKSNYRNGIRYHKVTKKNFIQYSLTINQCIELFKSQCNWDEMWNYTDAKKRLNDNHILYIMTENEMVLGYVWYNNGYLYNTFVSKTRTNGDSQNFINYTLNELKTEYEKITLYCDDWNIKAQKFFKGIGFINLTK